MKQAQILLLVFFVMTLSAGAATVASSALTAKAYIMGGLTAMWDGHETSGWGLRGDVTADGWKDLAGGCVLSTNVTSGGSVTMLDSGGVCLTNAGFRVWDEGGAATAIGKALATATKTVELAGRTEAVYLYRMWLTASMSQNDSDNSSSIFLWYDLKDKLHGSFCVYKQNYNEHKLFTTGLNTDFTHALAFSSMKSTDLYANGLYKATRAISQSSCTPTKTGICLNESKYADAPNKLANTVIRAVRIYSRTLSADELAWNAMLDRHRFLGASLDESVSTPVRRVSNGEVQGLAIISNHNPSAGTVSLTYGSTTVGSGTPLWSTFGASETLTYRAAANGDGVFMGWTGDLVGLTESQLASEVITVPADSPRILTAHFVSPTAALSARAYVSDGLVAHWDGVENVGRGTHGDIAEDGWTDLVGGCTLAPQITDSYGHVTTLFNGVTITNATLRAYDAGGVATKIGNTLGAAAKTVELAARATGVGNGFWLAAQTAETVSGSDETKRLFLWYDEKSKILGGLCVYYKAYIHSQLPAIPVGVTSNMDFTCVLAFSDSKNMNCYANGVYKGTAAASLGSAQTTTTSGCGLSIGAISAGTNRSGGRLLEYHGIRLYNRQISSAEAKWNAMLDRYRFFDEFLDESVSTSSRRIVNGVVQGAASVTTNAAGGGTVSLSLGSTTVGADETFWVPFSSSEALVYRATPMSKSAFLNWTGETSSLTEDQLTNSVLTLSADEMCNLTANFVGDDVNPVARTWTGEAYDSQWASPLNWSPAGVPAKGDSITIPSGMFVECDATTAPLASLTIAGKLTLRNWTTCVTAATVTVQKDGVITVASAFSDSEMSNRVWIACTDFDLQTGGTIDVSKLGYTSKCGPGWSGTTCGSIYYGASYGGQVGSAGTGRSHVCGSVSEPTDPGTGGGASNASAGGAVRIDAANSAVINGSIVANGVGPNWNAGGGATGGGVFIACRTISGEGSIEASSVTGNIYEYGREGGSGGRIAVRYDPTAQASAACHVRFTVLGSISTIGGTPARAAGACAGTIWFPDDQFLLPGSSYADCGWRFSGEWHSGSGATKLVIPQDVRMDSSATYFAAPITEVDFQGSLSATSSYSGVRLTGGNGVKFHVGGDLRLDGVRFCQYGGSSLRVDGDMILGADVARYCSAAELYLAAAPTNATTGPWGCELSVGGTLLFNTNTITYFAGASTNGAIPCVTARDVYIRSTSTLSADALGWAPTMGPGRGDGSGPPKYSAGHGGNGAAASDSASKTNNVYGSLRHPLELGSGGGREVSGQNSRRGGGAIFVTAERFMKIDGTVTANGVEAYQYTPAGSGGSIHLKARKILPSTGTLLAQGGASGTNIWTGAYEGGGGRIAIWRRHGGTNGLFISAAAGGQVKGWISPIPAGDGTVYLGGFGAPMCLIVK